MKSLGAFGLLVSLTLLLIYALSQSAARPTLSASPNPIIFQAKVGSTGVQARHLHIANRMPAAPLTWTITVSPTSDLQPLVLPLAGSGDATVTVQIDDDDVRAAGTYTAAVIISAEPATTINSPLRIPVVIEAQGAPSATPTLTPKIISLAHMQFGLAFISSPDLPAAETRYQRATLLAAHLDRWPMYWYAIETDPLHQPRVFDWRKVDAHVSADFAHGLDVLPILMLTPPHLATGGNPNAPLPHLGELPAQTAAGAPQRISSVASPPHGLYEPIFADGSDLPDPGKAINLDNRWAIFVYEAVNRYKPGGVLAQQQGWPASQGILHWEIWNEPDYDYFFSGTPADYARLLKVAYLSARHADPQAYLIFGGLSHFQKPTWFSDVLGVLAADPQAAANHGFMDAVASHTYAWAWKTFDYLSRDRAHLDRLGYTTVQLWLTETGVPVCDDPAPEVGPFCPSSFRATMREQADFLIQSAAWAAWLKAAGFVWFQFYDDVGNQCPYDAFGLVRNLPQGPCTHRDGSPRAAYTAYLVANTLLSNAVPDGYERRGNQEILSFKQANTNERLVVMWARSNLAETALIPATSGSAWLIDPDGSAQTITSQNGLYAIPLPGATNYSTPTDDGSAAIGGSPRILIEYGP